MAANVHRFRDTKWTTGHRDGVRMIIRISAEIFLAIVAFLIGGVFWQFQKRRRFLKQVVANELFLSQFITRSTLEAASPMITPFAEKNEMGYLLNVKVVIDADRISQRRVMLTFGVVLLAILLGSYMFGLAYLAINVVVVFLSALSPILQSTQSNALEHVLAIALILHKWHAENASECERWIEHAYTLRPLYSAVKRAQ
jgi:hypothetical protein